MNVRLPSQWRSHLGRTLSPEAPRGVGIGDGARGENSVLLPRDILPLISKLQSFFTNHASHAFLVGGTVRDAVLGRPRGDLDLVVQGNLLVLFSARREHIPFRESQ